MSRILVFQHVPFEILGTLNPLLKNAGFRIRYVNFGRHPDAQPSLDGYAGLVVLGGPMGVGDQEQYPHLATEIRLLREALDRGMPILGICLGAQLMAAALGAEVRPNPVREIGWYDVALTEAGAQDPVFRNLGNADRIFQWHSDTFDLPAGAVHLASSPTCANQAFRVGSNAYGVQFHLEADAALIERWLTVPVHQSELADAGPSVVADRIREETVSRIEASIETSRAFFGQLVKMFGVPTRRRMLRTR